MKEEVTLLPATFIALRTQGLSAEGLRLSALGCFSAAAFKDARAQERFWNELIACRRKFLNTTGIPLEQLLASANRTDGGIDNVESEG
jgi:hypothetical protein